MQTTKVKILKADYSLSQRRNLILGEVLEVDSEIANIWIKGKTAEIVQLSDKKKNQPKTR